MVTLSLSEAKMKLSELIDLVLRRDEEVTITRNGRPAAVLISPEQFESQQETATILSDPELMKEIKKGLKQLKKTKRLYTLEELLGDSR